MAEIGFPVELSSKLDYTSPAEVSSLDVRLFPNNISSIQSATVTVVATTEIPLPTSTITFALPTGAGKGQFLDHRFTRLNFRVTYEAVTAGTTVTATTQLRSGAHTFVQRMWEESQSGVVVSDQPSYDIIADMDSQFGYDVAQRDANAMSMGFESTSAGASSVNSNTGHVITGWSPSAGTMATNYNSYSIPVLSPLIGAWAKKFFQIGAVNRHTLNIQLPALAPISLVSATPGGSVRVTIDQISLTCRLVNVPMEALKLIGKSSGVQYYNGTVGRVASQSLGNTSGSQSWLVGIRGSSVKNLFSRFTESVYTTSGCVNRQFDSKMPLYTSIGYNVNGVNIPASPDDLVHSPAQAFSRAQLAMAQFNGYDFKSGIVPGMFAKYLPTGSTLPTDLDSAAVNAGTGSAVNQLCAFHYAVNLERISKAGILSGMNLNSGSVYLNVNSGAIIPSNSVVAYFVALLDSLIIHDLETGELSVRL
jgi:hypothetical protein